MSASENGWQPAWVGADQLQWVLVPGTKVNLQIQKGQPLKILRALAADFNAYIEPLRDADSASYTPTNSVSTSNHLNGTAMDLNWDTHPFHAKGTFTAKQMKVVRELLDFYEGTIFWAGDWRSPIDEMHWQMGYGSYGNPKTDDFIVRKIRSDGYSTFRRGSLQAQTKPDASPATTVGAESIPREQWDDLYAEFTRKLPSRSPLRHVGEGPIDTVVGFDLNSDANIHVLLVKSLAEIGDQNAISLLAEVAGIDPERWPDRKRDSQLAKEILAYIEIVNPVALQRFLKKG